jgi:hypothetical protein
LGIGLPIKLNIKPNPALRDDFMFYGGFYHAVMPRGKGNFLDYGF